MLNYDSLEEILKPQNVFYQHILEYARMIESHYDHLLKPYQEGIYIAGSFEPVIVASKQYFTHVIEKGVTVKVPIKDISKVNENIYNTDGKIVVPAYVMQNKENLCSNSPFLPTRGALIVLNLIKYEIASISRWENNQGYRMALNNSFTRDAGEVLDELMVDRLCESLTDQVKDFIGKDTWNIYFTKLIGVDVCVEKCTDYRIHEWTLDQIKKSNHEQDV